MTILSILRTPSAPLRESLERSIPEASLRPLQVGPIRLSAYSWKEPPPLVLDDPAPARPIQPELDGCNKAGATAIALNLLIMNQGVFPGESVIHLKAHGDNQPAHVIFDRNVKGELLPYKILAGNTSNCVVPATISVALRSLGLGHIPAEQVYQDLEQASAANQGLSSQFALSILNEIAPHNLNRQAIPQLVPLPQLQMRPESETCLEPQTPLQQQMRPQPETRLEPQTPLQQQMRPQPETCLEPQTPLQQQMRPEPETCLEPQTPLQLPQNPVNRIQKKKKREASAPLESQIIAGSIALTKEVNGIPKGISIGYESTTLSRQKLANGRMQEIFGINIYCNKTKKSYTIHPYPRPQDEDLYKKIAHTIGHIYLNTQKLPEQEIVVQSAGSMYLVAPRQAEAVEQKDD